MFSGENVDDVLTADADSVSDDRGVVNFTSVEPGRGPRRRRQHDVVNVTASPDVGFHVRGHSTCTSIPDASDRLHVDRNGGTPTAITYNPGSTTDGQVTFADRQPITFSGIRQITGLEDMKPTASAGGPYEVVEGKTVVLDGSASRPFEGTAIASYEWDFDYDGVTFDVNATGVAPDVQRRRAHRAARAHRRGAREGRRQPHRHRDHHRHAHAHAGPRRQPQRPLRGRT